MDRLLPDRRSAQRRAYLESYAERRRPAIEAVWAAHPVPEDGPGLGEAFREHLESLATLSSYFLARVGLLLRLEVTGPGGGTWDAHLGPDHVRVDLEGGAGHADYRLRLESRWLAGVVSGRTRWEELLLSLRFSARREPDHYNDYLVGLLKHADLAALRAVEHYEQSRDPQDVTVVEVGPERRTVSRYCPHAGEDLCETGVVVERATGPALRCLGHNFEFDLRPGSASTLGATPSWWEPRSRLRPSEPRRPAQDAEPPRAPGAGGRSTGGSERSLAHVRTAR